MGQRPGADGRNVIKFKSVHVGFLRQVTRKKTQRLGGKYWRKVAVYSVLHALGTQPLNTYIDKEAGGSRRVCGITAYL